MGASLTAPRLESRATRIEAHVPFVTGQKTLGQTADSSSQTRRARLRANGQVKRSGGLNRVRCLGDFISYTQQLQYVKATSWSVPFRSNYPTHRVVTCAATLLSTLLNGLCNPIPELFLRLLRTLLNILTLLCGLSLGIFEPRNPGFLCLIYTTFQVVN